MFTAGRPQVITEFHEATSYYGAHMGTCHHVSAYAEAWIKGRRDQTSVIVNIGDLTPAQATERARALVRG